MGRHGENELLLLDDQVSRSHAEVRLEGSDLILFDKGSRNGVFFNGKQISKLVLEVGVEIRLGATDLRYEAMESSELGSAPAKEISRDVSEEPTSIRFKPEQSDPKSLLNSISAIRQCGKLFASKLGLEGILRQILRIFFQSFLPDRSMILWRGSLTEICHARTRAEGDEARPFSVPEGLFEAEQTSVQLLDLPVALGSDPEKRSVLIAPLRSRGAVRGWIYADRSKDMPVFGAEEVSGLEALSLVIGGIIDRLEILKINSNLDEKQRLLEKHLSSEVVERIIKREIRVDESNLALEEKEITILFSDIEGFTPLSERLTPSEIATLLNEYLQRMVETVEKNEGMVNKFIGDAVMALFGAPESRGKDALHAVQAAWEMLEALELFNQEVDPSKRFRIRIGVNTGNVVAGEIGSERRVEYTVLGDAVNLASRLESISAPNSIMIGPETAAQVENSFNLEKISGVKVKGKTGRIEVFRVLSPK